MVNEAMVNATEPSQEKVLEGAGQLGDQKPQADEQLLDDAHGTEADAEAKASALVYTEEQWGKRGAEADRRESALRATLVQQNIQQMIATAQAEESRAVSADAAAVENGILTEGEAAAKRVQRTALTKRETDLAVKEALSLAAEDRMQGDARVLLADKLEKEHGLKTGVLMNDPVLTDGGLMTVKALVLKAERLEGEVKAAKNPGEKFDTGLQGRAAGSSVENMTPEEKISFGLKKTGRRR
jgi:hypothetical protein